MIVGCMTVKWLSSNSVLMIVGFIGSLLSAFYAEKLGRKRTILGGSLFMIVGAILQACSQTRSQIIVGRIISGLGMGHINATVPILQAEMSTPKSRGQLGTVKHSRRLTIPDPWDSLCSTVDLECWNNDVVLGMSRA